MLHQDVEAARQEAVDNVSSLQPLRKYLEKLNTMDDFQALADLFKPIMHVMLLIWKHSKYYNQAARFVTLIREICNDLIMQVGVVGTCRQLKSHSSASLTQFRRQAHSIQGF